jgi:5-methylthioadenosine/S-adenosylhomocysteine deaminase
MLTLISDAVLVDPTFPPRIENPGWALLDGNRIHSIGAGNPPEALLLQVDCHVNGRRGILMPGLVNAHTHAAMTLFRGLADDLPLKEWLEGTIFPAEARTVTEETVYWGTLLACAEMIRSGTTSFANAYFYEDLALTAVKESGMRAILAQGVLDFPTPDCQDPSLAVERAVAFLNRCWGEEPVCCGIFCHAPYTCSPETLVKAKEACRLHGVPFFMHVSETRWEMEEIGRRFHTTPLRHMEDLGLLDEGTVLVHGVWLDDDEIDLLRDRGAGVVSCTESNMKLASGIAPLRELLAHGVRVGLGTDGPASNNDLDMFGEMDLTAKLHKAKEGDPTVMGASTVLNLATRGGASLLGWKDVGLLEPGYKADLILLRTDTPRLQPLYNPVSQLVYAATGADVDTVWIEGRKVMEGRRLLTLDLEEIISNICRLTSRVKEKT